MTSEDLEVEATGETVGEAKWVALRELEKRSPAIDKSLVRFEVVSEGERGLLGVGYEPARVRATVADSGDSDPPPRPAANETADAQLVREILGRITEAIGVRCRVEISEDEETIVASFTGRDLGVLIGKHGQTIDAVQYLVNAIVYRKQPDRRKAILVDAAGYRERRRATLDALAMRSAERVVSSGERVELEPMTAVERKIVHVRLKEHPGVETTSEGTEPNRFVVIAPRRDD